MPTFTALKSDSGYTDYVIIGIATEYETSKGKTGITYEKISEFCIIHYKASHGRLYRADEPIIYGGHAVFEALYSLQHLGNNVLVIVNNSLVALGSSDFGYMLDQKFLEICLTQGSGDDYALTDNDEVYSLFFVASAPPTIVKAVRKSSKQEITIVDIANYGIKYLDTIWENMSEEHQQRIPNLAELGVSVNCCDTVAALMAHFMLHYHEVCRVNKLGSIALTYAGQAMKYYRRRHYAGQIKPHADEEVAYLEECCYTGGRGEARFHGWYHGKVYLLDIQSLYPSQALDYEFPTELIEKAKSPSLNDLESWTRDSIVFAHVRVKTGEPIYAKREVHSTTFPVGTFNSYLCGNEFTECLRRGHIENCYFAARYRKSAILRTFSESMLNTRSVYKAKGARLSEFITKCITNGLWGKFGQLGNRWLRDDNIITDIRYGGFVSIDSTCSKEYQYRVIDGICYKLVRCLWQDNTFVPVSAMANSISRYLLWRYMQFAGLSNVLYCSIDGLIVTEEGYKNLTPFIAKTNTEYGKFKVSEEADSCYIYKYGCYKIGNKVAYMGMPRDNTIQRKGFWNYKADTAILDRDEMVTQTIVTRYRSALQERMLLGSNDKSPGSFTAPNLLEEPILNDPVYSRRNADLPLPFVDWLE